MRPRPQSHKQDDSDKPPEYSETCRQEVRAPTAAEYPAPHTVALPVPTPTQLHLFTKNEDIKGTFYVDPSAPRLFKPSKAEKKVLGDSQASFRSRKGKIEIDVGTTGCGPKASAVVSTKNGDVCVNILPLLPGRPRISLDVSTRTGKTVLFIPDSYRGIIRLTTKKGNLEYLPSLSTAMQTFKMSAKEALIYVGMHEPNESTGDFCQITSKNGDIAVGIAGRDKYPSEAGLWRKLGNAIHQLIRS